MSNTQGRARAYLALGSNLQQPQQQVTRAIRSISHLRDSQLVQVSSLYRSAALGYADQPDFINAVVSIDTQLDPHTLLTELMAIEHAAGRIRSFRNAPRVIDLDILLYNQLIQNDERLTLPHPRMHERAFVLTPLLEIAPDIYIPGCCLASDCRQRIIHQPLQRLDAVP